jgi:lysophospholipase
LTLLALTEGEDRFAAAVLSAPMVGIVTPGLSPNVLRRLSIMNTAVGLGETYTWDRRRPIFDMPFEGNPLTHDVERWNRFQQLFAAVPTLRLGDPTWSWLAFATSAMARLARPGVIEQITIPLSVVTAGADQVCDSDAAAKLAARAPLGRHVDVPGAHHEILLETDARRHVFWRAFDAVADEVAPR